MDTVYSGFLAVGFLAGVCGTAVGLGFWFTRDEADDGPARVVVTQRDDGFVADLPLPRVRRPSVTLGQLIPPWIFSPIGPLGSLILASAAHVLYQVLMGEPLVSRRGTEYPPSFVLVAFLFAGVFNLAGIGGIVGLLRADPVSSAASFRLEVGSGKVTVRASTGGIAFEERLTDTEARVEHTSLVLVSTASGRKSIVQTAGTPEDLQGVVDHLDASR